MEPGCTPERVSILKAYGVTVQYYSDIPGFNEIVAQRQEADGKRIIVILPDDGMKYLSTKMYQEA
ncbi:MAG: hypothetical protein II919_03735 [Lachnospiraceae bacterium]|nr:hypothetical protein [Lachnospiraceae bacterium]